MTLPFMYIHTLPFKKEVQWPPLSLRVSTGVIYPSKNQAVPKIKVMLFKPSYFTLWKILIKLLPNLANYIEVEKLIQDLLCIKFLFKEPI